MRNSTQIKRREKTIEDYLRYEINIPIKVILNEITSLVGELTPEQANLVVDTLGFYEQRREKIRGERANEDPRAIHYYRTWLNLRDINLFPEAFLHDYLEDTSADLEGIVKASAEIKEKFSQGSRHTILNLTDKYKFMLQHVDSELKKIKESTSVDHNTNLQTIILRIIDSLEDEYKDTPLSQYFINFRNSFPNKITLSIKDIGGRRYNKFFKKMYETLYKTYIVKDINFNPKEKKIKAADFLHNIRTITALDSKKQKNFFRNKIYTIFDHFKDTHQYFEKQGKYDITFLRLFFESLDEAFRQFEWKEMYLRTQNLEEFSTDIKFYEKEKTRFEKKYLLYINDLYTSYLRSLLKHTIETNNLKDLNEEIQSQINNTKRNGIPIYYAVENFKRNNYLISTIKKQLLNIENKEFNYKLKDLEDLNNNKIEVFIDRMRDEINLLNKELKRNKNSLIEKEKIDKEKLYKQVLNMVFDDQFHNQFLLGL